MPPPNVFSRMFPDSSIAKKFACGHTKMAAIIKEALGPHFLSKTINETSKFFSIMIEESNNKTDKSCIILVRVFDSCVGDIRTRFLDMPIVNVGTACNLFDALKLSLGNHWLDFSKFLAFMSDTTNVMKGTWSGVKKLIRNQYPHVFGVGCI